MNEVKKLWYNSLGELRMLKEWEDAPPEKMSAYAEMASYNGWKKRMERFKSDSLPVVNDRDNEISQAVRDHHGAPLTFESFYDLPGATWEEKEVQYDESGNMRDVAFIHLSKDRGAGDDYPVIEQASEKAFFPGTAFRVRSGLAKIQITFPEKDGIDPGVKHYYDKANGAGDDMQGPDDTVGKHPEYIKGYHACWNQRVNLYREIGKKVQQLAAAHNRIEELEAENKRIWDGLHEAIQ
jgi:hypothetical protein